MGLQPATEGEEIRGSWWLVWRRRANIYLGRQRTGGDLTPEPTPRGKRPRVGADSARKRESTGGHTGSGKRRTTRITVPNCVSSFSEQPQEPMLHGEPIPSSLHGKEDFFAKFYRQETLNLMPLYIFLVDIYNKLNDLMEC